MMHAREVAMRVAGGSVRRFDVFEAEGGRCPICARGVELGTCCECGTSAWVIDCAHRRTPSWLRRGRRDGSERARVFCGDCADVLPARELPA